MKTFLRIIALIFLGVLLVVVIGSLSKKEPEPVEEVLEETIVSEEEVILEEEIVDDEETLEEIIDPVGDEDDGVIILGGDGIPNN